VVPVLFKIATLLVSELLADNPRLSPTVDRAVKLDDSAETASSRFVVTTFF